MQVCARNSGAHLLAWICQDVRDQLLSLVREHLVRPLVLIELGNKLLLELLLALLVLLHFLFYVQIWLTGKIAIRVANR